MTTKTKTQTKTPAGPQTPKPAKLTNKTEVRNAQAKADKLIRGIDNNNASIVKHQEQIEKKVAENAKSTTVVRSLIAGIGNVALNAPAPQAAKPAAKPATAKPVAKAKPAAKPAKPVKAAKPMKAKAAAKPKAAAKAKPAAKPKAAKASSSGADLNGKKGYKLDEVARDFIVEFKSKNGKSPTAAEIYTQGCVPFAKKHAFKPWSRQSLYNQLKIPTRFVRTGEGPAATFDNVGQKANSSRTTDADAENYVKGVEKNAAVANVS